MVTKAAVTRCPNCGGSMIQDEDDTLPSCLSCSRDLVSATILSLGILKSIRARSLKQKCASVDVERMRYLKDAGISYRRIAEIVGSSHEEVRLIVTGVAEVKSWANVAPRQPKML